MYMSVWAVFPACDMVRTLIFSIRIMEAGYRTRLFPSAWVYHKRRTDLMQFFRQVRHSGRPGSH